MNFLSLAKYILLSCILSLVALVYLLEHDQAFKKCAERHIKRIFLHSFKSVLQGTVKRVSLISGEIELEKVTVTSPEQDDSWHWHADYFLIQFSWISFLVKGKFDVTVVLDALDSHSCVEGSHIFIIDHLINFIAGAAGFPATLKMLTITKGHFVLADYARDFCYQTFFNGSYGNIRDWLSLHLMVDEGLVCQGNQEWGHDVSGTLHLSISDREKFKGDATIAGKFLAGHQNTLYHFDGRWCNDQGQFFLNTPDHACSFSLYNWIKKGSMLSGDCALTIPLGYSTSFLPIVQKLGLRGSGTCQAHITYDHGNDYAIEGEIDFNEVHCCGSDVGTLRTTFSRAHGLWKATGHRCSSNFFEYDICGTASYHERTGDAEVAVHNSATIPLVNGWSLGADAGTFSFTRVDSIGRGSYRCALTKEAVKNSLCLEGTVAVDAGSCTTKGSLNTKNYEAMVGWSPAFGLKKFILQDQTEKTLLSVACSDNHHLEGTADVSLIQEIMQYLYDYKISGQGIVSLHSKLDEGSRIQSDVALLEGNIRIPGTYTIVRGMKAHIQADVDQKKVVISDALLELDKGSLAFQRAVIHFSNKGIAFMYVPCTIKKAFLTLQKELFAVFSGNALWVYDEQKGSQVNGKIIIDRGYFKKNIFAQLGGDKEGGVPFMALPGTTLGESSTFNIMLETKKPLEVKTSFLETDVVLAMTLQGAVQNPEISGQLSLQKGTLAFPYRSLTITHGTIYFLPHQWYDPMVELIAKGKVRKYQVVLRCNGSLQNPHINFESTPPLTEEQIITLLLAGSEEGSLSLAMPALIMQKLQNVIFGPEQSALKLEGYFKSLLSPLKHIRFIPAFSGQSGRGGFRGAVEIDVNDQLRGMIQKNFSLPDDIRIEVEYCVSDDIAVRGMRDERGDYGGEVEMRWKF